MFVGCLLPSARMAIFSKVMSLDPAVSLQNLAQLRPEVVLPDLLDRYTYIHTLTYTYIHKTSIKTCVWQCLNQRNKECIHTKRQYIIACNNNTMCNPVIGRGFLHACLQHVYMLFC